MAESAAAQRTGERARGIGNFNRGGKSLKNGDVEFVRRNGKFYVRRRPQTTKDQNQMRKNGEDPTSTKRDKVSSTTEAKATAKAEAKTQGKLLGTDKPQTLAEGKAGKLEGEYTVGGGEASASAEAALDKDGVEVKTGAAAKVTLVGGKLVYTLPELPFSLGGQQLKLVAGTELSAEVAAEAKGEVGLAAKKDGGKVKVGASAGGEAFAGAKAGFKIFGKLSWKDPSSNKHEDVVGASAGAEGWAGAAAAAKIQCSLAPSIKANAYWGAAVGIGAAVKLSIEINAIKAARLSYLLAAAGLEAAWEGLERFGKHVAAWLKSGAARVVAGARQFIGAVSDKLSADDDARAAVAKGLHRHMNYRDRAKLIDAMISGFTGDEDEDAIIQIMRFAKSRGDLWAMVGMVDGGKSAILSDLHGKQDDQARRILGV